MRVHNPTRHHRSKRLRLNLLRAPAPSALLQSPGLLLQRVADQEFAQFCERYARRTGRIGQKRRSRHTGNCVRFQNPARSFLVEDEVGPLDAGTFQRLVGAYGHVLHLRGHSFGQRRRAQMLGSAGSVFGLVVVEHTLRNDLDDGKGLRVFVADDGHSQFRS